MLWHSPSFEEKHFEPDQENEFVLQVKRTFLDVVVAANPAPQPRVRTMPALPEFHLEEVEEPAPGGAVAQPSFEEKHFEPDQENEFVLQVKRTFLEVVEAACTTPQPRVCTMPALPEFHLEEVEEPAPGGAVAQPSFEEKHFEPDQENEFVLQVKRTFLDVVEAANPAPQPRVCTMPALPEFDLVEEPAPGGAVAQPSFEEKHFEPDQDHKLAVRVKRTFLEVIPDVIDDSHLRSSTMPILPSWLEFEEESEDEESFGAFVSHAASEPIPRGTPIFQVPEEEMESQAMAPVPYWAEPFLPGLVAHPAHADANVDPQTWEKIDVERTTGGEEKAVSNEDERAELKLVSQHADTYPGPFPSHMVEQHNNGRCFPCIFFSLKGDGCKKGDDCTHCHVCRPHEIRRRRNRIAAEMKAARRASARRRHHGA